MGGSAYKKLSGGRRIESSRPIGLADFFPKWKNAIFLTLSTSRLSLIAHRRTGPRKCGGHGYPIRDIQMLRQKGASKHNITGHRWQQVPVLKTTNGSVFPKSLPYWTPDYQLISDCRPLRKAFARRWCRSAMPAVDFNYNFIWIHISWLFPI